MTALSREYLNRLRPETRGSFPKSIFKSLKIFRLKDIEKERKDGLKREVIQIEDIDGNKADIIIYQASSPLRTNMDDVWDYFKKYTHVGKVHIENKKFDLKRGDKIATHQTNLISLALEETGVSKDDGIQLTGASVVIVPDRKDPGSIKKESLQKAIGFLFSKEGPFSEMLIFPDFIDESFAANLEKSGTELLIKQEFFDILLKKSKKFFEKFVSITGKDIFDYLIALSAYLKKELSIPAELDGRGLASDKEFINKKSEFYLERLIEEL